MSETQPPKKKRLGVDVKIDADVMKGVYANRVVVAHSRDEFIIDFVCDLPPAPQVVARVITAPAHARAILQTLTENVRRYESMFGPIRPPAKPLTPGEVDV